MTYIPRQLEEKIVEAAGRYLRIQNFLNELSGANLKKLIAKRTR